VKDKLPEVVGEIIAVRRDLGSPPLVAPITQMIIMQAVLNVAFSARYQRTSREIRDYVRGFYGRAPEPIDDEIRRKIIRDEAIIDGRPADLLPPALAGAAAMNIDKSYIRRREDLLSYALLPQSAVKFFAYRENPDLKADIYRTSEAPGGADSLSVVEEAIRMVTHDRIAELFVEEGGVSLKIKKDEGSTKHLPIERMLEGLPAIAPVGADQEKGLGGPPEEQDGLDNIVSPIVGTFYEAPSPGARPFVRAGDIVEPGDTVCIIEAMKLMNEIQVDKRCRIVRVMVRNAEGVVAGQTLFKAESL
jgi:oxaloacetate decarboxylase alpha subunit